MNRKGFTLAELMIALIVFGIVTGAAVMAMRSQTQAFAQGADRIGMLQNLRYVVGMVDQDLRTIGSGVPDNQPFIVYAGEDVLAYNANMVSNVANDVTAVYLDPDAPSGTVSALRQNAPITIPNTAVSYPDTNYALGPFNSPAETIVFFFRPDSTTSRSDDYVLYRQVNRETPELVARNLLKSGTTPFFEYTRLVTAAGGVSNVQLVPNALLPWRHSAKMHGSAADTAVVARVDSLRGVRLTLRTTNGLSGPEERTREISRFVRFPNAGIAQPKTCGDEPLAVAGFAAVGAMAAGSPVVNLSWPQATDEASGEADAMRYVIFRRPTANPLWGDPYLSIPVGNPTYVYQDQSVNTGESFMYALAVQDCTPALSVMVVAGPVVVP